MTHINIEGGDIQFSVSIQTFLENLKAQLGLAGFEVCGKEVGFYEDVSTHNSEYQFHADKSKKKYLEVLRAIEVLQKSKYLWD